MEKGDALQLDSAQLRAGDGSSGWTPYEAKHGAREEAQARFAQRKRAERKQELTRRHSGGEEEAEAGSQAPGNAAGAVRWKLDVEIVKEYTDDEPPLILTVWDFGGQEGFKNTHHLFLSRFGVYLLVFDMTLLMSGADPEKRREALEELDFWLKSVYVHTSASTLGSGKWTNAPVLLVGTHKDACLDPAEHEAISNLLYEKLGQTRAWIATVRKFGEGTVSTGTGLLWFFPVDNILGRQDPVIGNLMAAVEELLSQEDYINREVPLGWLATYDELRRSTQTTMSWEEFRAVGARNGLPTKPDSEVGLDEEMQLLARYFTGLGFIMYHPEPALADLVILNPPQFLAKPASMVICDHRIHCLPQHEKAKREEPVLWKVLLQAVLDHRLLAYLWADIVSEPDMGRKLETLMVKFGLLVPLVEDDSVERGGRRRSGAPGDEDSSTLVRYLVPALLPEKTEADARAAVGSRTAELTCYLVFGDRAAMGEWQRQQYVTLEAAAEEGFLPGIVFPRLQAKLSKQMQLMTGHAVEAAALSKGWGVFSLGKHELAVTNMPGQCAVRLDVFVRSSAVVDKVQELAEQVLREMMMLELRCAVAVPSDGGQLAGEASKYSGFRGRMVLLKGLREAVELGRAVPVEAGVSGRLDGEALRGRFKLWLRDSGMLDWYDVFLSYRWGGLDSEITEGVFTLLSQEIVHGRAVRAFLDKERLETGSNFQMAFANALANSTVAVPVVSHHALAKMQSLDAGQEDNVLLEWVLLQHLLDSRRISKCLPILIGTPLDQPNANGAMVGNFFADGRLASLPTLVCSAVLALAATVLSRLEPPVQPSRALAQLSVRETVEQIAKHLGVTAWDIKGSHGRSASTRDHDLEAFKGRLVRRAAAEIMDCLQRVAPHRPQPARLAAATIEDRPVPELAAGGSLPSHAELLVQLELAKAHAEAEKAKAEVERAKADGERAKAETAKAEAERAQAEAAKAEAEAAKVQAERGAGSAKARTCVLL
mmetsp:Transcript_12234/g.28831  ORF Transcript_12234/g.28831 Transcript_12234/m.28831 type:complete len:994 (-) Transcript_12234:112-3093(-)